MTRCNAACSDPSAVALRAWRRVQRCPTGVEGAAIWKDLYALAMELDQELPWRAKFYQLRCAALLDLKDAPPELVAVVPIRGSACQVWTPSDAANSPRDNMGEMEQMEQADEEDMGEDFGMPDAEEESEDDETEGDEAAAAPGHIAEDVAAAPPQGENDAASSSSSYSSSSSSSSSSSESNEQDVPAARAPVARAARGRGEERFELFWNGALAAMVTRPEGREMIAKCQTCKLRASRSTEGGPLLGRPLAYLAWWGARECPGLDKHKEMRKARKMPSKRVRTAARSKLVDDPSYFTFHSYENGSGSEADVEGSGASSSEA